MSQLRHRVGFHLTAAALAVALTGLALATVVVGGTGAGASTTTKPHESLTVLAPRPGQIVTAPTMPVHVIAHGYRLNSRYAGTPDIVGIGHFHTIIDGHLIDMSPPPPSSNRDTISMVGLNPRPHALTIVPAGNDHMEVTADAVNIPFTYAGPYLPEPTGYTGSPSINLTGPTNGSIVSGTSMTLTADIGNFVLCGDCFGKTNVAGEGHWHIFLDLPPTAMEPMSMMPHMMTMASDNTQDVSLVAVTPGSHTFTAMLVGNDHMPIMAMAMAMASITVSVQSPAHHHVRFDDDRPRRSPIGHSHLRVGDEPEPGRDAAPDPFSAP